MADDLLGDLLRQVSRSFYLSLAILPRPLREPIGLAYLLARAADTVADTRLIVREERVRHVETLRRASGGAAADVAAVARACATPGPRRRTAAPRARRRGARAPRSAPGRRSRRSSGRRRHAHDWHGLRSHALPRRGRREPDRARHARRARPLHVSRRRLCRPLLDGAARRPPPTAPALGPPRHEREGRELRQGAPDDQRAPRRPERSPKRPLLPARGRAGGAGPRPEGPPRA